MYSEVAWELVSSGTEVQLQIIPEPDYLQSILPFFMTRVNCKVFSVKL